jgi:hypothetical protein
MFKVGQEITTKYGSGVIVYVSSRNPHVYVRVRSRSNNIYVLNLIDINEKATNRFDTPQSSDEIVPREQFIASRTTPDMSEQI